MSDNSQDQVSKIVLRWIKEFTEPLDDEEARKSISSLFSPNICWYDHAFHIQRVGYEAVLGLRKAFNHCNQPFETKVKKMYHTTSGVVVEAIWVGCCKNDIVRPNGDVAVKANGRDFIHHVCFVVEVSPSEGITRIDEYYNKPWWDGISEEGYLKVAGSSMRS